MILLAEHYVRAPDWKWYILGYFFLAGLSAGTYTLGVLLRLFGRPGDERAARFAFLAAFPLVAVCPILLTVDLGQPLKFWHMIIDPAQGWLNFKYWSPMSVGVYALTIYAGLSFVSFVGALYGPVNRLLEGILGKIVMLLGAVFGLYICAYTGVLLSVSNQPVWSDGWPLGGLFVASALSGSAALLLLISRRRAEMGSSVARLSDADRYFVILEAILLVVFLVTVVAAGTAGSLFTGLGPLLWVVVVAGLAVPLLAHRTLRSLSPVWTSALVLAGVLALRAVVIFGPQG